MYEFFYHPRTKFAREPTEGENSLTGKIIGAAKALRVFYKDVMLDCRNRVDLLIEDQVIVEIKSIAGIAANHEAQRMSYLKLSDSRYGLLINFNVKRLRERIRRFKI